MGDSVSVRYNPADPNEALLTSSSDVGPFIFGGLGGLFFLLGLIIEIIAIRNRYRPDTGVRYTTDIDAGTQYATDIGTDVQYAQSTDIDADAQYATGIDTDVPYTTDIDAGAQYAQSAEIGVSYGSSIQVRASVVFFCIFLFLGIIFFGVGLILLNQSISFQRTATGQATGTIIHCDETTNTVKNSNGTTTTSTACSPTIRFATSEGRTIDFIPSESSSGFHVGQSIPVSYNPQAPQQAQISSFFGLWGFPIVFLGIGGIFLIVIAIFGFFMWRAARKRAIG
jgi:hypothetical protein